MNVIDQTIVTLRAKVNAAHQEFDMAVACHEVWKPCAYDEDLRKRMGVSYATNAFKVVRMALRREVLLSLMRLWDRDKRAAGMLSIAEILRDERVIHALVTDRATRIMPDAEDAIRRELGQHAGEAIKVIEKYSVGGTHHAVFKSLKKLRNERLAHRQAETSDVTGTDATDQEIETFYQDTSKLIALLLSLVMATAYDPQEHGEVYSYYAKHFWAGVRGEKTEGHPHYRRPLVAPQREEDDQA